jgi:hypothetical protein
VWDKALGVKISFLDQKFRVPLFKGPWTKMAIFRDFGTETLIIFKKIEISSSYIPYPTLLDLRSVNHFQINYYSS